jgi:hypothetical protein
MRSFDRSPRFKFSRLVLADDAAIPTGEDHGWNFEGYERALFQLVPVQVPLAGGETAYKDDTVVTVGSPTSSAVVEVFFWNRQAGLWLAAQPAITFSAFGAGVPKVIDVPVAGRRTTLKITGVTATQGILVYTAAYSYSTME